MGSFSFGLSKNNKNILERGKIFDYYPHRFVTNSSYLQNIRDVQSAAHGILLISDAFPEIVLFPSRLALVHYLFFMQNHLLCFARQNINKVRDKQHQRNKHVALD